MITYQEEAVKDLITEIKPLLTKHWLELANHKTERPLEPDFNVYVQLNESGSLRVFTVRDDGHLIGYFSFYVADNAHYKSWKYAVSDVYYLAEEYRKKSIAQEMFFEMFNWLQGLGVKSVTVQEKINKPHTKLFETLGFNLVERVYEKVL